MDFYVQRFSSCRTNTDENSLLSQKRARHEVGFQVVIRAVVMSNAMCKSIQVSGHMSII